VFSRVVFGARYSLMIGASVVLISVTGGVLLGPPPILPPAGRADHARRRRDDVVPGHPAGNRARRGAGASMTNVILALAIVTRRAWLESCELRRWSSANCCSSGGARTGRRDVADPVHPHPEQHRFADPGAATFIFACGAR
jgi:hypothetical protein